VTIAKRPCYRARDAHRQSHISEKRKLNIFDSGTEPHDRIEPTHENRLQAQTILQALRLMEAAGHPKIGQVICPSGLLWPATPIARLA
jgi:hypothetical protein